MTVTPRRWDRNGATLELRHLPRRKNVALIAVEGPPDDRTIDVLAWLTDPDADTLARLLDRMLPPATYGDDRYGA